MLPFTHRRIYLCPYLKVLIHRWPLFLYPYSRYRRRSSRSCRLPYRHTYLEIESDFLAIATLGFGILVRVMLTILTGFLKFWEVQGDLWVSIDYNLEVTYFKGLFLVLLQKTYLFQIWTFLECIKADELASTSIGIDVATMKLIAFTYGCFLAGVGWGIICHLYTFLHHQISIS